MIFISYAHEDEPKVRAIASAIRFRTDYDIWRDTRIRAGHEFNLEIDSAIQSAKAVVIFWSQNSVRSRYVIAEASRGSEAERIIPVRIDDCRLPTAFGTLETIDLTGFEDSPPYGDDGLSRLISEISRYEKLPHDILTVHLNAEQTDQYELARRIAGGVHVFVGMNSREAVGGMPFVTGLNLIGFTAAVGLEPDEYSGMNVLPIFADVDRANLVILAVFPTLLVHPRFYEMVIGRSGNKPVFVVLFGPVSREDACSAYEFIRSVPENRIIQRKGVGFPLEGEPSRETWALIRTFLRSIEAGPMQARTSQAP